MRATGAVKQNGLIVHLVDVLLEKNG